jgi:Ala-tRNA(Pro) deacylase
MKLLDYLDEVSADYELTRHDPTFTAQQMAAEEHVHGMNVAKPVIVDADGEYYMCVLPACCKIDFDLLKREIGADEIRLAEEGILAGLFDDCSLGAEPPFGKLYGMLTLMDRSLVAGDHIVFQAGTHEDCIHMSTDEFKRLAEPRILDFSYHMV